LPVSNYFLTKKKLMAIVEILMPQMGESVMEATIISWLKKEGEKVEIEEPLLEVATDKVDTEVPAIQEGIIQEFLAKEGDVVQIGAPIAILNVDGENLKLSAKETSTGGAKQAYNAPRPQSILGDISEAADVRVKSRKDRSLIVSDRFYSPLVRNMAKAEHISMDELDTIPGTGKEGRVTKKDMIRYLKAQESTGGPSKSNGSSRYKVTEIRRKSSIPPPDIHEGDQVIEMDRVRRIIADRMVESRNVSAHVHSFVDADVTKIVKWRNKVKDHFQKDLGIKLTFTPIFIEALAKTIQDFPMINISVDGYRIIKKKQINIGIAVALPDGNLIVPVIKNADQLNLVGLARQVNDFADRGRSNQLSPDEVSGSTYTLTNVGSFGATMGTPIILQPNVGILAIGAIEKKPAVIETEEYGDVIAIRQKMTLSHSYDHRVIDGALGSMFVTRVGEYLENFDDSRTF
jgi:2-oxoglutarate dehydrogenase E2 component (dihydrolipoamide succinyltransferase)